LASCSYDDTIKFWTQEDDDWECASTLNGHESTVWSIDFTKDGKYLASVSDDTTVKIWLQGDNFEQNPSYSLVSTLQGYHKRTVYSCSWNHDGTFLATVSLIYLRAKSNIFDRLELMIEFVCLLKKKDQEKMIYQDSTFWIIK